MFAQQSVPQTDRATRQRCLADNASAHSNDTVSSHGKNKMIVQCLPQRLTPELFWAAGGGSACAPVRQQTLWNYGEVWWSCVILPFLTVFRGNYSFNLKVNAVKKKGQNGCVSWWDYGLQWKSYRWGSSPPCWQTPAGTEHHQNLIKVWNVWSKFNYVLG